MVNKIDFYFFYFYSLALWKKNGKNVNTSIEDFLKFNAEKEDEKSNTSKATKRLSSKKI